jgi:two-component system cell cycle response regulator
MLGKILIVDQIAINRIALRAKLGAAQFDVSQASTIKEALNVARQSKPDLILTDVGLPDGSAAELVSQLDRTFGELRAPVMVLSPKIEDATRLALLSAGANDVVSKPLPDLLLLARIRSHVREANADSEWRLRDDTSRALGLAEAPAKFATRNRVRLVGRDLAAMQKLAEDLEQGLDNVSFSMGTAEDVMPDGSSKLKTDAYVLVLGAMQMPEMLRLLSTLRCHRETRHAAILVVQADVETELAAYALDMGASDLVTSDASVDEIALRLEALLRRKSRADQLRATVRTGLEAAVSDPLTGLHNRRYAIPHMRRMLERATQTRKPVACMVADMDHFKRINDTYGHAAGDSVLVETAERLRENLRAVDLVARIGGEEFLIVLPNVTLENAHKAAERLCIKIHETPYTIPGLSKGLMSSISIGLTVFDPVDANGNLHSVPEPQALLERADEALYKAKSKGRNRVRLFKPAA